MKIKLSSPFKPAHIVAPRADLAEQIVKARTLHQQGNLADAAALYRKILTSHPEQAEIYYRYGNLLKDQRAFLEAVENYDRAIALRTDYAQAYCNRGVVLGFLERLPEAFDSYDRAIELEPKDAIAHCNRAILLLGFGKKDAALAGFDEAIAQDVNSFTAYFYRGALLQERKLWAASLGAYSKAIAINPGDAATYFNQGTVQRELSQWDAALNSFGQAIALNKTFTLAYSNRADVLERLDRLSEAGDDYSQAITLYDRAIALNPRDASIFNQRALLLQKIRRYEEALADYDAGIGLSPNDADIWFNRGTLLSELDNLDAALQSYSRAIAIRPGHEGAYINHGITLQNLGQMESALASYQKSIDINPNLPESQYNMALARLALGDYSAGWPGYEQRWGVKKGPLSREKREFREPLWRGKEDLAGKTILLYAEQGLGDALQFCRYVELIAKLGARVVLEVPRPLVALCAALPGTSTVVASGSVTSVFEYQCPLMSLPLAFGTTLENIPSAAGYLRSDPEKVASWLRRLGAKTRPRIGLTWSGNRSAGLDRKRHFALAGLIPYLPHEFQFFCLQTDVCKEDQETLETSSDIFQFPESDLDFGNTAALCQCMDLVISVDTSIAHLSGGLGKSTWVLLPYIAEWRWLTKRDDSPWYRSVKLFRQQSPGDWNGVFERISAELRTGIVR